MNSIIKKNILNEININIIQYDLNLETETESKSDIGFIILRHVNSNLTNNYWKECYNCIRKYYSNLIVIIDDNSNYTYIDMNEEKKLINCIIIKSEFPQRGEILPYYYYHKYNWFKKAVIIHDSVFIQKFINFEKINKIKFIFHFEPSHEDYEYEHLLLSKLTESNDLSNLIKKFDKNKWNGCFGVMSVIDYEYLNFLQQKYNFLNLIHYITHKIHRCCLERIFGLICYKAESIYGDIMKYIKWGYTFNNYIHEKNYIQLDIIKVWSGR